MNVAEDKYIDGELSKEEYNRFMERYQKEASTLKARIEMLKTQSRSNIEPQLNYSISLISNISSFMQDAPVEVKIKVLGSMFPEKIEFDGKEYRTKSYNKVVDLIYLETSKKGSVRKVG